MLGYLLKRIALAVPMLLIVSVAIFGLMRLIPGDPAQVMLGEGSDPAALAAMHRELGLDQPLVVQYLGWLARALRGDLGVSVATGEPVLPLILSRAALTGTIVLIAVALATLIAIVGGIVAAGRRGGRTDIAISWAASLVLAVPSFWLGLLLLLLFGVKLHWLPVVGFVPLSEGGIATVASFLILPIATLTVSESGVLIRMMRSSAINVLQLDYVTHARAKGLRESAVLARHVFPNAFSPTLTLVALTLGHLLGGIAVIETVFTLPGLGRLMVDAILARDYPVVQGCLLFTATVYVAVNLIVDLLYPVLDPRVTA